MPIETFDMVRSVFQILSTILTLTKESASKPPSALATVKRAHMTAYLSIAIGMDEQL